MRKCLFVTVICMMASFVLAQDLNWYTTIPATNQAGSVVMSHTSDPLQGGMVQLIKSTTGSAITPVWSGTGIGATETLASSAYFGQAGVAAGLFDRANSLASYGLLTTDQIYVRVFDRPTTGSGNMPTAYDYGGGMIGVYYFDTAVSQISSLPYDPFITTYSLDTGAITQGSWSFLAIPEPGTIALGLLGLGALITRRFLRK